MKVQINFNSNDENEIRKFRDELLTLIKRIDLEVLNDDDSCLGRCDQCDREECRYEDPEFVEDDDFEENDEECGDNTKYTFNDHILDNIRAILQERIGKYMLYNNKEIEFDNEFIDCVLDNIPSYENCMKIVDGFEKLLARTYVNDRKNTIVYKLIKAGLTEEFAKHTADVHFDKLDESKIPEKFNEAEFIKFLEYIGVKEDIEAKKKRNANAELLKYTDDSIKKATNDEGERIAIARYIVNHTPKTKEDVDRSIASVLDFLRNPPTFDKKNTETNEIKVDIKRTSKKNKDKK